MIQDILRQCGYPPTTLVLDAETYYDKEYTLSKMSTWEYVTDGRFEVLGWAVKHDSELAYFYDELPDIDYENTTVVMQNAFFDALVLARHYDIYPKYIVDILDLARHVEPRWSNKLAALCERHGLPAKGDTKQFMGLHKAGIKEENQHPNLALYAMNDAEREYDLLNILLPQLSNPTFELKVMEYTRNSFLSPILQFNFDRAEELEVALVERMMIDVALIGASEKEIRGNKSFEALLREALGSEEPPMKRGKKGMILAIAKTDAGYERLLNHENERISQLMQARVACKSLPLHIKRIDRMRRVAEAGGGKLAVPLSYCGAHTGRWSGREGINLQNLPARADPLANQIRTLIEAPEGHVLMILDFSQIEARVLAWLAGQNDLVRAFAEGRAVYCDFASQLTGHRIRKPRKTDSGVVAEWYGHYRQMGKIGILGAGYGLGWEQCMKFSKNTYGITLVPQEAKRLINLYRKQNQMVVRYWNKVERAFKSAVQNPGTKYGLSFGIEFFREDTTTFIQLPSTRRLRYIGARVEGSDQLVMPNPASHDKKIYFWGGYLVENCLAGHTRVVTDRGIVLLSRVKNSDLIWDGEDWVAHKGLVSRGVQQVVGRSGIDLTPDHLCMTDEGWKHATDLTRFEWADVRSPYGNRMGAIRREEPNLARPLRMRAHLEYPFFLSYVSDLWYSVLSLLFPQETAQRPQTIWSVGRYEIPLHGYAAGLLQELRRAGHTSLQALGQFVRGFLGRYERYVCAGLNFGADRQRWRLPTGELSMGNVQGASTEQTRPSTVAEIPRNCSTGGGGTSGHIQQTLPRAAATEVFDLLDCGPRHRFCVLDDTNNLRLVHNCVQAVSRDLLAEAVLKIEALGVRLPLIVHDDMAVIVPVWEIETYRGAIEKIIKTPPVWAGGLPIDAECRVCKRYEK